MKNWISERSGERGIQRIPQTQLCGTGQGEILRWLFNHKNKRGGGERQTKVAKLLAQKMGGGKNVYLISEKECCRVEGFKKYRRVSCGSGSRKKMRVY